MKTRKIFSIGLAATIIALAINCTNEDEAITIGMTDVSSRLTGFSSEVTGAGAPLSVTGSQMDQVQRVFIGNLVVPKKAFTNVSGSGFTFNVPSTIGVGDQQVLFVWPGSERGFSSIEVVPLQVITSIHPVSGAPGDVITIHGDNLLIVETVQIGGVAAVITEQTDELLKFTIPDGASTGAVTLSGVAGTVESSQDVIACESDPTNIDCAPALNLNSSFELGAGDDFNNWGQWNGGNFMTETTNPANVFRGTRALEVVRDGTLSSGQWRLQLASDEVPTEIGASYTVYIWVKATQPGGAIRVSTNPSALYTGDQEVPTTWTRLEFSFTANIASTRVVLDMNGNETVPTVFYVDDVKLLKN